MRHGDQVLVCEEPPGLRVPRSLVERCSVVLLVSAEDRFGAVELGIEVLGKGRAVVEGLREGQEGVFEVPLVTLDVGVPLFAPVAGIYLIEPGGGHPLVDDLSFVPGEDVPGQACGRLLIDSVGPQHAA